MVVGHSLLPVRRRGTRCRNVYRALPTALLFWPSTQNTLIHYIYIYESKSYSTVLATEYWVTLEVSHHYMMVS